MRVTLSRLQERAPLFATHMISQSFERSSVAQRSGNARLDERSLEVIEALISWLSLEEGQLEEWEAYVAWVRSLEGLSELLGCDVLRLPHLMRLIFQLEAHLLTSSSSGEAPELDWLAWRRRCLSACERVVSLCEVSALFKDTRRAEAPSSTLAYLSSLAFGEASEVLHEPLCAQLEGRFNVHSALSSRHIFTLASPYPSWWTLSLSELLRRRGVELISLEVREGSAWEPLQSLTRQLLSVRSSYVATELPEHRLLRRWSEPLAEGDETLSLLEQLSPPARLMWLRRAMSSVIYELSTELNVRLCVWITSTERLSSEEGEALARLLKPSEEGRGGEAALIMIAQHAPEAALPESLTRLEASLCSPFPSHSILESMGLDELRGEGEGSLDLAVEWEALWLLAVTDQLSVDEQGRAELSLAAESRRYERLAQRSTAHWEALYLQLTRGEQESLELRAWRATLSSHVTMDERHLSARRAWFGGETGQLWAPIERLQSKLMSAPTISGSVSRLKPSGRQRVAWAAARAIDLERPARHVPQELARCLAAVGGDPEGCLAWERMSEELLLWWGVRRSSSPAADTDRLERAAEHMKATEYKQAEELLAAALSKGERGRAYWRSVRASFGLLCWLKGEQREALLFLDEVLTRELEPSWGARLQARASLIRGLSLQETGSLREASLALYGASRIARSVGELSLLPLTSAQLSRLALATGERATGLSLLREARVRARERGLSALTAQCSLELSLWALHYGALSHARKYIQASPSPTMERRDLPALLWWFSAGLYAVHDKAWGEALNRLALLSLKEPSQQTGEFKQSAGERSAAQLYLEGQLLIGLTLLEADPRTENLIKVQGLARDVRLHRAVSPTLALFARYLELRVVGLQPHDEASRARELRSRLYELREEWGEQGLSGELSLDEALLYTLCGVEVGAALGSALESLTELESLKPYLARSRAHLQTLGWHDTLGQRWELQRIQSLLPMRGQEAPWILSAR